MTKHLHALLTIEGIFNDAPEYARGVKLIKDIVNNTTFADAPLEQAARDTYAMGSSDDIEIDPEPPTSVADGGTWVQAWVWVEDSDVKE